MALRCPGAHHPPTAVHLQMRMDARWPNPDEQMLAPAEHLVHKVTTEVDGGVLGHADIASGQCPADQRIAQGRGGTKDGVALRHYVRLCRRTPV